MSDFADRAWRVVRVLVAGKPLAINESCSCELGQSVDTVEIVIGTNLAVVAGRVISADESRPVESARVRLERRDEITDLSPLVALTSLRQLGLPPATTDQDLRVVVARLSGLSSLTLVYADLVRDITPLAGLPDLTSVALFHCPALEDLSPLKEVLRRGGTVRVDSRLQPQLAVLAEEAGQAPQGRTAQATQQEAPGGLGFGDAAPLFEATTFTGEPLRLADLRGKYVLLDFWATWCGPCLVETPHLKAVYEEFGHEERFCMIGLSLDEDVQAPKRYAADNGTKWVQAFLGDWPKTGVPDQYGVSGIPTIFLIGPDGKIIARDLLGEAMRAAVRKALSEG